MITMPKWMFIRGAIKIVSETIQWKVAESTYYLIVLHGLVIQVNIWFDQCSSNMNRIPTQTMIGGWLQTTNKNHFKPYFAGRRTIFNHN